VVRGAAGVEVAGVEVAGVEVPEAPSDEGLAGVGRLPLGWSVMT
jgi:hypothetical protein